MSLLLWASQVLKRAAARPPSFTIARTLDRTFVDTPASGGGNVSPDTFVYNGQTWEVWQVVPFLAPGVSPIQRGDCRVHIRNRAISRDAMQLADMPVRVVLSAASGQTADWLGLPWTFTRPTNTAKFTSPGSGNEARRSIDYERAIENRSTVTPTSLGIAQGETFSITLEF